MGKNMLGLLPLSEVQGVLGDITAKLASADGKNYFAELKKFARKEECWKPQRICPVDHDWGVKSIIGNLRWTDVDADGRSLVLAEVDFSKVFYENCLMEGEDRITGEQKLQRLVAMDGIRLDQRFAYALYSEKGQKILERIYKERGITSLDFFGKILVSSSGERYAYKLQRLAGTWSGIFLYLSARAWSADNFSPLILPADS